jgi:hypothetical protein
MEYSSYPPELCVYPSWEREGEVTKSEHIWGTDGLCCACGRAKSWTYMDKYPGGQKEWDDLHGRMDGESEAVES